MYFKYLFFLISILPLSYALADTDNIIRLHDNEGQDFDSMEYEGPRAKELYEMLINNNVSEILESKNPSITRSYVDTPNVYCYKNNWLQRKIVEYGCQIKINY